VRCRDVEAVAAWCRISRRLRRRRRHRVLSSSLGSDVEHGSPEVGRLAGGRVGDRTGATAEAVGAGARESSRARGVRRRRAAATGPGSGQALAGVGSSGRGIPCGKLPRSRQFSAKNARVALFGWRGSLGDVGWLGPSEISWAGCRGRRGAAPAPRTAEPPSRRASARGARRRAGATVAVKAPGRRALGAVHGAPVAVKAARRARQRCLCASSPFAGRACPPARDPAGPCREWRLARLSEAGTEEKPLLHAETISPLPEI
jgi:hypothetical protein